MHLVLNYLGRPSQEVVGYLAVWGSECCPSEAIVATEAIVAAHAERNTFPMCGRNAVLGEVCDCHSLYYLSHTVAIDQKTDSERGFGLIRTYFFHWRLSFNMQGKIGEFKPRRWHIVMKIFKYFCILFIIRGWMKTLWSDFFSVRVEECPPLLIPAMNMQPSFYSR